MKFEQTEMPHPHDVTTALGLKVNEIVFDKDGIPWIVGDVVRQRKYDSATGNWSVPVRQAIYKNDSKGNGWIAASGVVCVAAYKADELVPVYEAPDLVRVVELDTEKFLVR